MEQSELEGVFWSHKQLLMIKINISFIKKINFKCIYWRSQTVKQFFEIIKDFMQMSIRNLFHRWPSFNSNLRLWKNEHSFCSKICRYPGMIKKPCYAVVKLCTLRVKWEIFTIQIVCSIRKGSTFFFVQGWHEMTWIIFGNRKKNGFSIFVRWIWVEKPTQCQNC